MTPPLQGRSEAEASGRLCASSEGIDEAEVGHADQVVVGADGFGQIEGSGQVGAVVVVEIAYILVIDDVADGEQVVSGRGAGVCD